jgi:hypothetical protein
MVGQPLDQVYNQTRREGLQAGAEAIRRELTVAGTLGYVRPGVPVRTPPDVLAVWIPAFVNTEGDLVSGHWVYMVRQQEKWFIEEETGPGTAAVAVPHSHPRPTRSATGPAEHRTGSVPIAGTSWPNPTSPPSASPQVELRPGDSRSGSTAARPTRPPTLIPPTPRLPVAAGGQP